MTTELQNSCKIEGKIHLHKSQPSNATLNYDLYFWVVVNMYTFSFTAVLFHLTYV